MRDAVAPEVAVALAWPAPSRWPASGSVGCSIRQGRRRGRLCLGRFPARRGWISHAPEDEHLLSALASALPQVSHPHRTPVLWQQYIEIFAGAEAEMTELVECTKLTR